MRGFPPKTYISFENFEELNSHLSKIYSSSGETEPLFNVGQSAREFAVNNLTYKAIIEQLFNDIG